MAVSEKVKSGSLPRIAFNVVKNLEIYAWITQRVSITREVFVSLVSRLLFTDEASAMRFIEEIKLDRFVEAEDEWTETQKEWLSGSGWKPSWTSKFIRLTLLSGTPEKPECGYFGEL